MLLTAALIALNYFFVGDFGSGGDFLVFWSGARTFLFEHIDPYSAYVPVQVQELVYGRPAGHGQQPYILDIPFHLLILFFPFALIPDPLFARAIFSLLAEIALFGLVFWSLRLADWRPHPVLSVLFFIFGVFNFYSITSLLEGSASILLGLAYGWLLFALAAEIDELAGALIALSFFKWEIGAPFLFLVAMRVFYMRRWRTLAGFGMLAFVLLVASFFWYPGWIIPFLRAVANNLRADFGFTTFMIFDQFWPGYGSRIAWALTTFLLIVLIYEWSRARGGDPSRFYWTACLTLAVTPLLGQRTEMENLAVLVLPLGLVLAVAHERWSKIGNSLVAFLMLFLLAGPWLLFLRGVSAFGESAERALFLFLPIFCIIGLYWIRWWAIRPPRVWADRVARLSQ